MPHDRNGALIEVGDRVTVEFEVTQVSAGLEFCNVSLKAVESMPGSESPTTMSAINTKQTVKIA